MSYNHDLINILREEHNGNWERVIAEYSKLTNNIVNAEELKLLHHQWRTENKLTKDFSKLKSKSIYDYQLLSKLKSQHNKDWAKIIAEYNKITGLNINRKCIRSAYSRWNLENKATKTRINYNHDITSKLVDRHGYDWKSISAEYQEITKTDVNTTNLRTSYYRTDYHRIGKRSDNKRKIDEVNNKLDKEIDDFISKFDETDKFCSEEVYNILATAVLRLNDFFNKF